MKVFYHCDDMASTPRITQRILDAWRAGLIGGFSVIANGNGMNEMVTGLRESPERQARIGVHLNLSEGRALSGAESVPLLADGDGSLKCGFVRLALTWLFSSRSKRRRLVEQVEREWRAQIVRTKTVCLPRKLSTLDGHIHVHMLPFLFPIAARLACEQEIASIRVSREIFYLSPRLGDTAFAGMIVNVMKHLVLRILSRSANRRLRECGLQCGRAVVGILYTGHMTSSTAKAGIETAGKSGAESVEVIFHIGRAGKEEAFRWRGRKALAVFPMSERRDREFAELCLLRAEM